VNVEIKVIPNAKKRAIARLDGIITVRLTALPLEGRANDELVKYLSETFKVKRSAIRIIRGEKGRRKVLSIPIGPEDLEAIFE